MFRTRVVRALVVWAVVSVVAGHMLVYVFGDAPQHPTTRYYHMEFGIPVGIQLPEYNSNPVAGQIYKRRCERTQPQTVYHRRVIMCVEDTSGPEIRAQYKVFVAEVDKDYRRYWLQHVEKIILSLLIGAALWLTVAVVIVVGRWIANGK